LGIANADIYVELGHTDLSTHVFYKENRYIWNHSSMHTRTMSFISDIIRNDTGWVVWGNWLKKNTANNNKNSLTHMFKHSQNINKRNET